MVLPFYHRQNLVQLSLLQINAGVTHEAIGVSLAELYETLINGLVSFIHVANCSQFVYSTVIFTLFITYLQSGLNVTIYYKSVNIYTFKEPRNLKQ